MSKQLRTTINILLAISLFATELSIVHAETLDSTNYRLKDITVDSGGGATDSSNYSLIAGIGNPTADSRLTSGSYELRSGFPNGLLANVPLTNCFETTTNSGDSDCSYLPNADGAVGECGSPGCYDRAKLEIDNQANPIDTLYLVMIEDITNTVTYYLKTDHTLGTTYTFAGNFMDRCDLEGIDPNNTACDDSGDIRWNASLQSTNILGLLSNTEYRVSVSAMHGDFTKSRFSPVETATTTSPSISFDIDIADSSSPSANNSAPYSIEIGELSHLAATTATNLIWLDINTNNVGGMAVYLRDTNSELASTVTGDSIPSESEDASLDPNNNGSYGVKTYNYSPSETALGPIQRDALYDTAGADQIGKLFTNDTLIFFTDNLSTNKGQVSGGRTAMYIKARADLLTKAGGEYNDQIKFNIVGSF